MIDLNKMVNDTVEKLKDEGFVEKVVKEKLEEAIKNKVDEILDKGSNREILNLNINVDNILGKGSYIPTIEKMILQEKAARRLR